MRLTDRLTAAILMLCLWTGAALAENACSPGTVFLRGDWGEARFSVEIADTEAERNRGLMFRPSLPETAGMLFLYPTPRRVGFWMKNTLIPLDMLFLDKHGVVRRLHHRAIPHDESAIWGGPGILAVLEINGGLAAALGITEGSQLRHPAFAAHDPAWPC